LKPGITHAAATSNSHCQAAISAYHVPVPRDTCSPDRPYRLRKPPGFWRPPVPTEAPTAFFSYSRGRLRLRAQIGGRPEAGASEWMDQLDIDPGQGWDSAVEQAVARSPRMLLILSPASVQSRNVRNEIAFALDEQKTIIPFLYQDCTVPLQLRRIQHIDFPDRLPTRAPGSHQSPWRGAGSGSDRDCSGGDPINRLAHRSKRREKRTGTSTHHSRTSATGRRTKAGCCRKGSTGGRKPEPQSGRDSAGHRQSRQDGEGVGRDERAGIADPEGP
jgi:hypothetical protein